MALATINVGQKEFYFTFMLFTMFWQMAFNVPAVNEGFLCPIRKTRSVFRAQKTLA
jgi:hypothetical protein